MKFEGCTITLSSGREISANQGILSPSPWDSGWKLVEGYDSSLHELNDHPLTSDEIREIAEYMIERWKTWQLTGTVE